MQRLCTAKFVAPILTLLHASALLVPDARAAESRASAVPAVCRAIAQHANSGGLDSRLTLATPLASDAPALLRNLASAQIRIDVDNDGTLDTLYAGSYYLSIRRIGGEHLDVQRDSEVDWDRDRFRWPGLLGGFEFKRKQYLIWGGSRAPFYASVISSLGVERVVCEFAQRNPPDRRVLAGNAPVCDIARSNSYSYVPFDRPHDMPRTSSLRGSSVFVSGQAAIVDIDNDGMTEALVQPGLHGPGNCDWSALEILNDTRDGWIDTTTTHLLGEIAGGCGSALKPFQFAGSQYIERQWLRDRPLRVDAVYKIERGSISRRCEIEHAPVNMALSEYDRLLEIAQEGGLNPWTLALSRDDSAALELLVRNGHDPNERLGPEGSDWTPLREAIRSEKSDHVNWLLAHGAASTATNRYGASLLLKDAIRTRNYQIVKRLLDAGVSAKVPSYELADLVSEKSDSGLQIALDIMRRTGSIPYMVAHRGIAANPHLADTLLQLELPVALDHVEWDSGELARVPTYLTRLLQSNPERLAQVEQLFARAHRVPGYGATAQYLNGDRGWLIVRSGQSPINDHEFLMMTTMLCVHFFDAHCGPKSLLSEALLWEERNSLPCADQALSEEIGPQACGAIEIYNARVAVQANLLRGLFTLTSVARWENHQTTRKELGDLRRARSARNVAAP